MIVAVHVPRALRVHTEGTAAVVVSTDGDTVAEVLDSLFELHPGLRDRIVTEQGRLRQHVALFVGSENVRHSDGLDTPVPERSEITIVPAVSGG